MSKNKISKPTKKAIANSDMMNSEKLSSADIQTKNSNIKMFLVVAAIVIIAYYFRDWFVAATVNGKPIMRFQVIKELEKQAGKQALDSLITKSLIESEAQNKNITVSEKEINNEIAKIENQLKAQGQSLDDVLAAQGSSRNDVREQARLQLMLEKIVKNKIKVTQQEIEKAYKTEKDNFSKDLTEADIKKQIEDSLKSQKFSTEVQKFLGEIKKKASIKYIKAY